ncbi:hypothetical protein [Nitrosomonas sp. Nm51]|nr:hypothetical protein [Nitrosomonas sp. Nm51]
MLPARSTADDNTLLNTTAVNAAELLRAYIEFSARIHWVETSRRRQAE